VIFIPLKRIFAYPEFWLIFGKSYPHCGGVSIFFPSKGVPSVKVRDGVLNRCGGTAQKRSAFQGFRRKIKTVIFMLTIDVYVFKISGCLSMIFFEKIIMAN